MADLVVSAKEGLLCVPGDFYIDPWLPVERAVITHAHADHARAGHAHYLAAAPGAAVLKSRLGEISLEALPYGKKIIHNGVTISLHPAGHVLGSAQVRLEWHGEVWVISGDYKLDPDGTCAPFRARRLRCVYYGVDLWFAHLPLGRSKKIFDDIRHWWRRNAEEGRASVLFCYAFGKAQRLLNAIDSVVGPIICHGAVTELNRIYRASGVWLPPTLSVSDVSNKGDFSKALIIAPPSAAGSPWMRRFADYSDGFASGWMLLRGARRRRAVDRGFVLSDHADWPGLMRAIEATGATRVIVTHGHVDIMVRWLRENGLDASGFSTEYGTDEDDNAAMNEAVAFKESHA